MSQFNNSYVCLVAILLLFMVVLVLCIIDFLITLAKENGCANMILDKLLMLYIIKIIIVYDIVHLFYMPFSNNYLCICLLELMLTYYSSCIIEGSTLA